MIIRETDLFKGMNFKELQIIAGVCSEANYAKGSVLFRQNDPAKSLFILEEGAVDLIVQNGGTLTYAITEPGEVFGWSSMLENGRYTASVVCATDLKAVKIEKHKLDRVFKLHPDVGLKVIKCLAAVFTRRLSQAYHGLLTGHSRGAEAAYG